MVYNAFMIQRSSETPVRITGVVTASGTQTAEVARHLDWLAFSVRDLELDRLAELVSAVFHPGQRVGLDGWEDAGGARTWRSAYQYLGAKLYTGNVGVPEGSELHGVGFSGEVCQKLGDAELLALIDRIVAWGGRVKCSRIDLALDHVPFTPLMAREALERGQVVCRAARNERGQVAHDWFQNRDGSTGMYIGSRQSDRFMRIYDRHGFTRMELEVKGDQASAVLKVLVAMRADEVESTAFVVGTVRQFIEFCERADGVGVRGSVALPWWEWASSDRVSCALLVDRRDGLQVDRTLAWLSRSVAPSLGLIKAAYGQKAVELLLDWMEGFRESEMRPRHRQALKEFEHAYGGQEAWVTRERG